jgi:hypothetical protein
VLSGKKKSAIKSPIEKNAVMKDAAIMLPKCFEIITKKGPSSEKHSYFEIYHKTAYPDTQKLTK